MKKLILALVLSVGMLSMNSANADFTVVVRTPDFTLTPQAPVADISKIEFDLIFSGGLVQGKTYDTSDLISIDYHITADSLAMGTPSGFPGFDLNRGLAGPLTGAEFDALSPDSSVNFAISAMADLSDGLQVSDLTGTDPVFTINAREFNQAPGRFHPPIFTLNSDGTGLLVNANNFSTSPNPGTTNPVNVQIGEEYNVNLSFDQNLTLVAVPEPASGVILAGMFGAMALRRRRRN